MTDRCYPYINPHTPAPGAPKGCEDPLPGRGWAGSIIYPLEHHHDIHPERGFRVGHPALDFDAPTGTPVRAAATGSVIWAGPNTWGYGNLVILEHGRGFRTLYAHLDTVSAQCGTVVVAGTPIGTVGETGQASFEHLHFEVRQAKNVDGNLQWWSCDPHRWFNEEPPPAPPEEEEDVTNLLKNPGFELDWSQEESHNCLVVTAGGECLERDIGNIFTPPRWTTWFRHVPDEWDQPEVRDAHASLDPVRVHSGQKAMLMFSFYRRHDGGFLQQVVVEQGATLKLSAFAHAWSSHIIPGYPDCLDNPRCSCGVGFGPAYYLLGHTPTLPEGQWNDAILNFIFAVGVDPTGGTDPYAPSVIWGQGAHIYNEHAQVPPLIFEAENHIVTVFLRSFAQWAFKHNDAYWDTVTLTPYSAPPPEPDPTPPPPPPVEGRGQPRVQYARTYVLAPPEADADLIGLIASIAWNKQRYTVGGSADDAGTGDLDHRRVVVIRPESWTGGEVGIVNFYKEYYPDVSLVLMSGDLASIQAQLKHLVENDNFPFCPEPPTPPPAPPPPPPPHTELNLIDPHMQTIEPGILVANRVYGRSPLMQKILGLYYTWQYSRDQNRARQTTFKYVRDAKPNYVKVFSFEDVFGVMRAYPGALIGVRHYTNNYGGIIDVDPVLGARRWVDLFRDALYATCARIDRDFPNAQKPYLRMEDPNELYPSNNAPLVARAAALDLAIALEIERTGLPIATIGYCAGVGNPDVPEYPLLVPLARTLERTGGAMGLHLYWWANRNESGLKSWWPHHAGRYQRVDEVLVEHGVHVDWLCGESGVVQSDTGHHLNAHGGWKDVMSWPEYLADLLTVNQWDNEWNKTHEGRFKGRAYFTTCATFCNWLSFRLGQPEFEDIARSLGG